MTNTLALWLDCFLHFSFHSVRAGCSIDIHFQWISDSTISHERRVTHSPMIFSNRYSWRFCICSNTISPKSTFWKKADQFLRNTPHINQCNAEWSLFHQTAHQLVIWIILIGRLATNIFKSIRQFHSRPFAWNSFKTQGRIPARQSWEKVNMLWIIS